MVIILRNEQIEIITKYPVGSKIEQKSVVIFAERKNLTRSEFYTAITAGLKTSYIFDINPDEYALADICIDEKLYQATHVKYNGQIYEIIRIYEKNSDSMEMTVGNGKRN